jgi:hypothetical protein
LRPTLLAKVIRITGASPTVWTYPGNYKVKAENDILGYAFFGKLSLFGNNEITLSLQREPLNLTLVTPTNESIIEGQSTLKFFFSGSNGSIQYRWDGGSNQTVATYYVVDNGRYQFFIDAPNSSGTHQLETILFGYNSTYLNKQFVFNVSNPLPYITLLAPTNESAVSGGIEVQLAFGGSNGSYLYRWDSGENVSCMFERYPRIPGTSGIHVLQVWLMNFDQKWNTTTYQFITANQPLSITLSNPKNGSFISPRANVVFSIIGFNGTFLYDWNDGGLNSTQEPFNTSLRAPNETGLQRLRIFVADWDGNWTTAYYEFFIAHFLKLNIRNASTGLRFTEGIVTLSNSSQTIDIVSLRDFPQGGMPLTLGNYTLNFTVEGLHIEDSFEVTSNITITHIIAQLVISPLNISTRLPFEQGFVEIWPSTGSFQAKTIVNQKAQFLVETGQYSVFFREYSWSPIWTRHFVSV